MSITKSKAEEYLEGWKRAKADYENLLKETEKARAEFGTYATEQCLIKILPSIDQFEVALQYQPKLDDVPENSRREIETWITGLQAVKSLWDEAAKELGLTLVRTEGALDPMIHDAVGTEDSETVASGEIVRATENGYELNGKLVRPAKVILAN